MKHTLEELQEQMRSAQREWNAAADKVAEVMQAQPEVAPAQPEPLEHDYDYTHKQWMAMSSEQISAIACECYAEVLRSKPAKVGKWAMRYGQARYMAGIVQQKELYAKHGVICA